MAKKVYVTIESSEPQKTLDNTLRMLENERGVTYAEGHIGRGGSTQKRRYELEGLFSGRQPEDYVTTGRRTK